MLRTALILFLLSAVAQADFFSSVIYRPGSPSDFPYVNLWAEVQDFVDSSKGAITVYLEQADNTEALEIGSLNGYGRVTLRPSRLLVSSFETINGTQVLLTDGAVLTDIAMIYGPMDILARPTLSIPFEFSLDYTAIQFELAARLVLLSGSTLPFIRVRSGNELVVKAGIGVVFDTHLTPGSAIFELEPSPANRSEGDGLNGRTMLQVVAQGPVLVTDDILSGDNTTVFFHVHDSSTERWTLASFAGEYSEALLNNARGEIYEDWRVQPSLFEGRPYPPSPGPTVQDALDVLKVRSVTTFSVSTTLLGENTFYFPSPVSTPYSVVFSQIGGIAPSVIIVVERASNYVTFMDHQGANDYDILVFPH